MILNPIIRITGKFLIVLDTHDLCVSQNLPKYSLNMVVFELQTSHGCLKLSEFYQESEFDIFICIPPL